MATQHYLIVVENDIEPGLIGPFMTDGERDRAAQQARAADPQERNGIFWLDSVDGTLHIGTYAACSLAPADEST